MRIPFFNCQHVTRTMVMLLHSISAALYPKCLPHSVNTHFYSFLNYIMMKTVSVKLESCVFLLLNYKHVSRQHPLPFCVPSYLDVLEEKSSNTIFTMLYKRESFSRATNERVYTPFNLCAPDTPLTSCSYPHPPLMLLSECN